MPFLLTIHAKRALFQNDPPNHMTRPNQESGRFLD
jgi:hypothetical protein